MSDTAAENFENESSSDSAQDLEKDMTVPNSEKTSEPSTQNNSSIGSTKPSSIDQNSVKPSEPASAPTNKPTTTTQPAVTACSHNWKLISYTNGCYVYNCTKCDDYKSEEREMNPNDFMGNKSEYLEFLALVNKARKAEGLNELQYCPDNRVQNIADIRAKELTVNFSHTRPDGTSSGSMFNEYLENGGMYMPNGEACHSGNTTAESAFNSLMHSPKHRAILMCESSTHFVCARCEGYWVCKPLTKI